MKHSYDLILKATIEIGGTYEADTVLEAIEAAKEEMRVHGEISDLIIERQVLVDADSQEY